MPENASKVQGTYYFADSILGSNEYHSLDLTDIIAENSVSITGAGTCTLEDVGHLSWTEASQGIEAADLRTINTNTGISIKINALTTGRYKLKFIIPVAYTDGSGRTDSLAYNIYLNVID